MVDALSSLSLSALIGGQDTAKVGGKIVQKNDVVEKSGDGFDSKKFIDMVREKFGDDVVKQIVKEDGSIDFQKFAEIVAAKKFEEDKDKDSEEVANTPDDKLNKAKLKELDEETMSLTKMMQLLYPDDGKNKDKNEEPLLSFTA